MENLGVRTAGGRVGLFQKKGPRCFKQGLLRSSRVRMISTLESNKFVPGTFSNVFAPYRTRTDSKSRHNPKPCSSLPVQIPRKDVRGVSVTPREGEERDRTLYTSVVSTFRHHPRRREGVPPVTGDKGGRRVYRFTLGCCSIERLTGPFQ